MDVISCIDDGINKTPYPGSCVSFVTTERFFVKLFIESYEKILSPLLTLTSPETFFVYKR